MKAINSAIAWIMPQLTTPVPQLEPAVPCPQPPTASDLLYLRNGCIEWMHRAKNNGKFHYSTLMFSIALLDRLIIMNFPLNSKTQELLAATLVLLSTKMNEIYPISVRRLNSLLKKDTGYSVEQFTMMEGLVLKQLDFNLNVEDTVHNGIAILVNKQNKAYALFVESIVKTFIKSVEMFQQGSDALLVAIYNNIRVAIDNKIQSEIRNGQIYIRNVQNDGRNVQNYMRSGQIRHNEGIRMQKLPRSDSACTLLPVTRNDQLLIY